MSEFATTPLDLMQARMKVSELEQRLFTASSRNIELTRALYLLVHLKTHKNKFGKTDYYMKEQPLAWEKAGSILLGIADGPDYADGPDFEGWSERSEAINRS